MADGEEPEEEEEQKQKEDDNNDDSCASSPCGANASCWNGDGESFLCTCDSGFPHGNPYSKCVKCVYDSHCPGGATCQEEQCVGEDIQGPQGFVQVGQRWFFISDEMLAWPQAQYACMNMEGE